MPNSFRLCLLLITLALTAPANSDWPTDSASPLVLGEVLGFGMEHVAVSTPDGATWVAWIDHQCFASLIVQRISAEGDRFSNGALALDTQDSCVSLTPSLIALSDNSVVVSAIGTDPLTAPVHRISADGQELWAPEVVATDLGGGVEALMELAGGDVVVVSNLGSSIMVGRYAIDGTAIWDSPAVFNTTGTSNLRIFALEEDGADGAYVLWDSPGAYTRRVYAMRVSTDGTPAWDSPVLMVDIPPGSSRHTDPVAIADGLNGLALVWTQGAEQSLTPVPLRMQRLFSDGTMLFDMSGARVSTASTRQFDAQVLQLLPGGDLYIAWRDGPIDDQEIRAQRLTLDGQRRWNDEGTSVTQIPGPASKFTVNRLDPSTLGIAIANGSVQSEEPLVNLHRVDALGQTAMVPWPLSGTVPSGTIDSASLANADALAIVWQREGEGSLDEVVAQRINIDGTLGLIDSDGDGVADITDNCSAVANILQVDTDADGIGNFCDADFNNDCAVNFIDYEAMTSEFLSTTSPVHDLNSDGVVNFIDISIFEQFFLMQPGPSGFPNVCEP